MEGRSLADVVMGVRPIDHPPEPLVESSPAVILGGFLILAGVLILAAFMWAARGRSEDGQPDPFGKMIKVHEVAAEYHTSWSPGAFWPSKEAHGKSAEEGHGSPIFKVVWRFLLAWLAMSGFFLVLAGAIPAIEVFRQEDHVRSAGCAALACVLCAIWPVLFRIGSRMKPAQPKSSAQRVAMFNANSSGTSFVVPAVDKSKGVWLWISCVVLVFAWSLALAAAAQLQAWTLPGPQFGTLILLAPGYGLFAGWLLYAAFLNLGVAMSFDSYPEGTRAMPAGGNADYIHRGSIWPVLAALILLASAVLVPDPVQPLPMAVALAFFTPRYRTNVVAVLICVGAVAFATWRMLVLRDWEF
jgi:hypothetical protein